MNTKDLTMRGDSPVPVQKTFWVVLLSRLALNMQMRVIYPFLPAISRGLGVPLQTTSLLLTARAIANLSSPLYGALSDRFGRRALMLAGLIILTSGLDWKPVWWLVQRIYRPVGLER